MGSAVPGKKLRFSRQVILRAREMLQSRHESDRHAAATLLKNNGLHAAREVPALSHTKTPVLLEGNVLYPKY